MVRCLSMFIAMLVEVTYFWHQLLFGTASLSEKCLWLVSITALKQSSICQSIVVKGCLGTVMTSSVLAHLTDC